MPLAMIPLQGWKKYCWLILMVSSATCPHTTKFITSMSLMHLWFVFSPCSKAINPLVQSIAMKNFQYSYRESAISSVVLGYSLRRWVHGSLNIDTRNRMMHSKKQTVLLVLQTHCPACGVGFLSIAHLTGLRMCYWLQTHVNPCPICTPLI